MAKLQFALGTTQNNLVYLFEMGVKAPRQTFRPYSTVKMTGGGDEVGQGWALDEWEWGFVDDAIARNALKTYCPNGLSSDVYVKTYNDFLATPAWRIYRAKMLWMPAGEERQNDHRMKFTIRFKLIEDVTPE